MKSFSKNQNKIENQVQENNNMAIFVSLLILSRNIDLAEAEFSDRCYPVMGHTRAVRFLIDPFKPFSTAVFA